MPTNHSKYTLPNKGVPNSGILYGIDPYDETVAHAIRVDATGALIVSGAAGGGGTAGANVDLISSFFVASADDSDGSDYTNGDILKIIEVVDIATGVVTNSSWYNLTTGGLIGIPPGDEITVKANSALTDAELRATPVEVEVVNTTERQFVTTRVAGTTANISPGDLEVSMAVESGYAIIQGTYMPAGYSITIRAEMQDTIGAVTIDATNGSVIVMEII